MNFSTIIFINMAVRTNTQLDSDITSTFISIVGKTTVANVKSVCQNIVDTLFDTSTLGGILRITDSTAIANITDSGNWSEGEYIGVMTSLSEGHYYYDSDTGIKYEVVSEKGTDTLKVIRFNVNNIL